MKKYSLFLLLFLFSIISVYSNDNDIPCGTSGSVTSSSTTGGIYIPSTGTLKVLVVFARMKDDTTSHSWWPVGGSPNGYSMYIDSTATQGSTNFFNLTNYYRTMSCGNFTVIGKAVSVETPNDSAYYGGNRYLATKEVLQQKVDPLVNFSDFDNWTYNTTYSHSNTADGTVDMIIVIWRGWKWGTSWYGIANLGSNANYTVEGETKTIKTYFNGGEGSGVTSQCSGTAGEKYTFHAVIHEVNYPPSCRQEEKQLY
jgi:hypothetical protein